jgi:hypothetical protein
LQQVKRDKQEMMPLALVFGVGLCTKGTAGGGRCFPVLKPFFAGQLIGQGSAKDLLQLAVLLLERGLGAGAVTGTAASQRTTGFAGCKGFCCDFDV